MLGAASVALLRRRLPGAPCVEEDDEGCAIEEMSRWTEAWAILRAGFSEARATASVGVEAIKQSMALTSANVGTGGLVTLQYVVNRMMPHRIEQLLEDALRESLEDVTVGSNRRKDRLRATNRSTARIRGVDGCINSVVVAAADAALVDGVD